MQVSLARVISFICEPIHPYDPHPGQPCDIDGPGTRCSLCTGLFEMQDPQSGEWFSVPLASRRNWHD